MIVTIARQVIQPACMDAYHKLAEELAAKSRAEAGCVGYRSVQSQDDARVHLFIECWKDQNAIDFHGATEHFTRIVPQFAAMFAEEEAVTRYDTLFDESL